MSPRGLWTVFHFEWTRTLSVTRLIALVALAAFPMGMTALLRFAGARFQEPGAAYMILFMVNGVTCLMALLFWATPIVHSELEGRTWSYLAVRPCGITEVLLGKFLNALAWSVPATWVAISISLLIAQPVNGVQLWMALCGLAVLAAISYGALYLFLGVAFTRWSMAIAVAYTLLVEVVVAFLPAMVNQFTLQYRLRSLLALWMDWRPRDEIIARTIFSDAPAWQHLSILTGFSLALVVLSILILRQRELVKPDEA